MAAFLSALLALICMAVGFVLSLAGGHMPIDLVLLGWVFFALWAVLTTWPGRRLP